jgi:hypothetical protein
MKLILLFQIYITIYNILSYIDTIQDFINGILNLD